MMEQNRTSHHLPNPSRTRPLDNSIVRSPGLLLVAPGARGKPSPDSPVSMGISITAGPSDEDGDKCCCGWRCCRCGALAVVPLLPEGPTTGDAAACGCGGCCCRCVCAGAIELSATLMCTLCVSKTAGVTSATAAPFARPAGGCAEGRLKSN